MSCSTCRYGYLYSATVNKWNVTQHQLSIHYILCKLLKMRVITHIIIFRRLIKDLKRLLIICNGNASHVQAFWTWTLFGMKLMIACILFSACISLILIRNLFTIVYECLFSRNPHIYYTPTSLHYVPLIICTCIISWCKTNKSTYLYDIIGYKSKYWTFNIKEML